MNEIEAYYSLTKKAFDLLAPVYNLLTFPLTLVRSQVVDFANPPRDAKILDIATGTGQQALAFAKHGYTVIGVDINESMLAMAKRHNQNNAVNFQAGDATRIPFDDNAFDITCISFALHDMPLLIRQRVIQQMRRVTKPSGAVIIVDYDLPNNKLGRAFLDRLITLYESDYYRQFVASDLEALLREIGVQIVERHSVLFGGVRILKGIKLNPIPEKF